MGLVIQADDKVGVKLFKLKILSNLLTHTLQENLNDKEMEDEIKRIVLHFRNNQYRETLLTQSEDFKSEKKRLHQIVKDKEIKMPKEIRNALELSLELKGK